MYLMMSLQRSQQVTFLIIFISAGILAQEFINERHTCPAEILAKHVHISCITATYVCICWQIWKDKTNKIRANGVSAGKGYIEW